MDVKRVEETGNKLVNSQISEEALVLSADPSKQEVSVKSWQQMAPVLQCKVRLYLLHRKKLSFVLIS